MWGCVVNIYLCDSERDKRTKGILLLQLRLKSFVLWLRYFFPSKHKAQYHNPTNSTCLSWASLYSNCQSRFDIVFPEYLSCQSENLIAILQRKARSNNKKEKSRGRELKLNKKHVTWTGPQSGKIQGCLRLGKNSKQRNPYLCVLEL